MTAATPGQAALLAYERALGGQTGSWKYLGPAGHAAWEAAAQAAIAAQDARPAPELAAAMAARDQARADRNSARNVVAEMAAHWQRTGTTREEDELIAQWLKIAGLTS